MRASEVEAQRSDQVCQWTMRLTGKVQGVGFRPFVYRLANRLKLNGSISNDGLAVKIIIDATESAFDSFLKQLYFQLPPQANIDHMSVDRTTIDRTTIDRHAINRNTADQALIDKPQFSIISSQTTHQILSELPADLATCQNCIHELFDPKSRHYLSPFISCVDCGPRYACITNLPYDRNNTTWDKFDTCDHCEQEYKNGDSDNRRFHSQGVCCNECGPRYSLVEANKGLIKGDAIKQAAELISAGDIVAVKGISGFHLVCDANNDSAISELRRRKRRPDKPFAMMATNVASLSQWVKLDKSSISVLEGREKPIVLAPKTCPSFGQNIAPGINDLGCILPYSPVYLLLFYHLCGRPAGHEWLDQSSNIRLVVTSANKSGEAIHSDNNACLEGLKGIADSFLIHDRKISFSSDDSVIQTGSPPVMIRRARSYAPLSIPMEGSTDSEQTIMAYGAHLKNTFCLSHNGKAILSPHIGELSSLSQQTRFDTLSSSYQSLLRLKPQTLCCDQHRDYAATVRAENVTKQNGLNLHRIQHHHAHFAAAMAEHQANPKETALGLVLDGTGLGTDGKLWGGELFSYQNREFKRLGHFEQLALPGGDKATREIWRIGAALKHTLAPEQLKKRYAEQLSSDFVRNFICHTKHIETSSAGRWFDAVSSLIGIRQHCSYEAQAAMELEALASNEALPSPLGLVHQHENQLIMSELVIHVLKVMDASTQAKAAALFHSELIDGLKRWLIHWSNELSCDSIYASGGVFQNRILREGLYQAMQQHGIVVKFQELTPINDGGISLGQAWIAKNIK